MFEIYDNWCKNNDVKSVFEVEKEKSMKNSRVGKGVQKIKDEWMERIQEYGYGKDDEDLMIRNQKYFQDVLDKHGVNDVQEFFDEEAMQEGKSFEDYEKIFDECFDKIPAKEFKKYQK